MLEGQNLSGQLSDWSIRDLLQIMHVTKKTGSLDISGDRSGRIHFQDGTVTGADLKGTRQTYVATDRSSVADVLYVLSSLHTGSFSVGASESVVGEETWSVDEILADVESLNELEAEVAESGLIDAPGVRMNDEVDEAVTLEPGDWKVIVGLVQPFTFSHLEARFGRGGAVRVLHTLHRLKVVEPIADDESQWLDQLAGNLSGESSEPLWLEQEAVKAAESHVDIDADTEDDESTSDAEEVEITEIVAVDDSEPSDVVEVAAAVDGVAIAADVRGVAAPASTTLTDGVYDEIRRLRSKVSDK